MIGGIVIGGLVEFVGGTVIGGIVIGGNVIGGNVIGGNVIGGRVGVLVVFLVVLLVGFLVGFFVVFSIIGSLVGCPPIKISSYPGYGQYHQNSGDMVWGMGCSWIGWGIIGLQPKLKFPIQMNPVIHFYIENKIFIKSFGNFFF